MRADGLEIRVLIPHHLVWDAEGEVCDAAHQAHLDQVQYQSLTWARSTLSSKRDETLLMSTTTILSLETRRLTVKATRIEYLAVRPLVGVMMHG